MSVPASCLHWQFPVFCVANVSYIIWENLKSDYLCIWLTLILIISCVGRVADLWKQCGSFCSWLQLIWETVTCSCFDCCFSLLKPLTCCQKQVKLLLLRQRPTLWLVLVISVGDTHFQSLCFRIKGDLPQSFSSTHLQETSGRTVYSSDTSFLYLCHGFVQTCSFISGSHISHIHFHACTCFRAHAWINGCDKNRKASDGCSLYSPGLCKHYISVQKRSSGCF